MSKPRFKVYAEVDTLAHAETIRQNLANRAAGKDIFEEHSLAAFFDGEVGKNVVVAEWRFNNAVDRDDVRDWIKDQVQNHPQVKNWVTRASVTSHLCTHDDAEVKDCRTTQFVDWERA